MVRLLDTSEVAAILGCSTRTVLRRIGDGRLPAFRDGGMVRVSEADLTAYIEENTPAVTIREAEAIVGIPSRRGRRRLRR